MDCRERPRVDHPDPNLFRPLTPRPSPPRPSPPIPIHPRTLLRRRNHTGFPYRGPFSQVPTSEAQCPNTLQRSANLRSPMSEHTPTKCQSQKSNVRTHSNEVRTSEVQCQNPLHRCANLRSPMSEHTPTTSLSQGLSLQSLLLICLILSTRGDEMLQLRSSPFFGSRRTSSTLMWKSSEAGKTLPEHAVPIDVSFPFVFWCRARLLNTMIPGEVKENGKCKVSFLKTSVAFSDKFDVLVSLGGSSRVALVPWDSYSAKPEYALQSPDRILAVVYSDELKRFVAANIGTETSDRQVYTSFDDTVVKVEKSSLLTEDEPIEYTLKKIEFEGKSKIINTPVILGSIQLLNTENTTSEVADLIPYRLERTHYWGKVKGTLTGLPTRVHTPDDELVKIYWGSETDFNRVEFAEVTFELQPNSGVNVTLMGMMRTFETPYSAQVESIYKDGFYRARQVDSLHIERRLVTVIAKYGSPFFLNGTSSGEREISRLVYEYTTTTTTTTTLPSTTTTSSRSSTTSRQGISSSVVDSLSKANDSFANPATHSQNGDLESGSLEKTQGRSKDNFDYKSRNSVKPKAGSSSTSKSETTAEKFLSGIATIFTALVFWYFGLGIPA